jgi:PKD repeat protein
MNLSHTWGGTNDPGVSCGNDNVSDTPQTEGWTTCNLTGKTCTADPSPVDNVQNYMEYSYCSRMFTNGQKARMIAAINSGTGQRNELWQTSNLNATGVLLAPELCTTNFSADNLVICEGESVSFSDLTFNDATGWNWTFTGGSPSTSTLQNPTITYNTPGTYTVSLSATDGNSTDVETKTAYITVLTSTGRGTPLVESFESVTTLPTADWMINNPDNGQAWAVTTAAAYTGSKSLKLSNSQMISGHTDDFVSGTLDLSGLNGVLVTFKYSFVQKNSTTNTDILKVYASNDCGETWSMRKQISSSVLSSAPNQSSGFTPNSISQWEEAQVTNISATYLVPNFRLKFSFESGGGNNIYIDDINISGPLGLDELNYDFNLIAYPNPFESNTTISFNLETEADVDLNVYDVIGKQVMSLKNGKLSGGEHTFALDGSNLGAGIYFVKLKAGNKENVMKVILQ